MTVAAAAMSAFGVGVLTPLRPASAATFVPIFRAGSTWAAPEAMRRSPRAAALTTRAIRVKSAGIAGSQLGADPPQFGLGGLRLDYLDHRAARCRAMSRGVGAAEKPTQSSQVKKI